MGNRTRQDQGAPAPNAAPADAGCAALERLFGYALGATHHAVLSGGAAEPLYEPATAEAPAQIHYTGDHLRSALHEIAHWCIAGPARLRMVDYGYWYLPDGRDAAAQQAFEQVEVRPQALELVFCAAMGIPFRVSLDNLGRGHGDPLGFESQVLREALGMMPLANDSRAACWVAALTREYRGTRSWDPAWVEHSFRSWRSSQGESL